MIGPDVVSKFLPERNPGVRGKNLPTDGALFHAVKGDQMGWTIVIRHDGSSIPFLFLPQFA